MLIYKMFLYLKKDNKWVYILMEKISASVECSLVRFGREKKTVNGK